MEEVEFITEEEVCKTIENFSIEELIDYKKKLIKYADLVEGIINKKLNQKKEADTLFK